MGAAKSMMKFAAALACIAILCKVFGSIDCNSRKLDPRTYCKCLPRLLLKYGYDEFEATKCRVTVHKIKDVKQTAMIGKTAFFVQVMFRWSKWTTATTTDLTWEQGKVLEIPQGASECTIILTAEGTVKNTEVGRITLETKRQMLDKIGTAFWGKPQRLTLMKGDKNMGVLFMTFKEYDDQDENPFIDSCDNDSPLGCELGKCVSEEPKVEPPFPKTGEEKLALLSRVLCGNLDEVPVPGKTERCYVKVMRCNFADLQGEKKRNAELAKQIEKAREKGLTELPQKWYWVWYENQKAAEKPGFPKPDGFFPMLSIVNTLRDLQVENQFTMRYTEDGQKGEIKYKRVDKQLDIWIEGLELFNEEYRRLYKDKKAAEDAEEHEKNSMVQMRGLHTAYCQSRGFPQTPEEWKMWFGYMKLNGNAEKHIEKFYEEIQEQIQQAKAQQEAMAKAKAKGAATPKGPPAAMPKR
eukprot:gnl/MRDRNA2_/MRDRNA2_34739_c0_seq1.p1 gnl/MRDRNA2_/MRDRNA2_34739_c0~~gnl/MRDRNA2_/MRDRNA2_34739_c0_seq1.p1  ORF type:complete len:492 (+),score=95.41 gnl/MRDRNA2_/MRDRNA2_34739_c0_seq1:79-1476(+)